MNDLRTAAQQALECLKGVARGKYDGNAAEVCAALEAALSQQAEAGQDQRCRAEPRPDGDFVCDCKIGECPGRSAALAQRAEPVCKCDLRTRLVGDGCEVCNPKLAAELAQQAEPGKSCRAWMDPATGDVISDARHEAWERDFGLAGKGKAALFTVPLCTAPPQRKPLPNHDQHCVDVPGYGLMAVRLVRAVERAHGIGGQDER